MPPPRSSRARWRQTAGQRGTPGEGSPRTRLWMGDGGLGVWVWVGAMGEEGIIIISRSVQPPPLHQKQDPGRSPNRGHQFASCDSARCSRCLTAGPHPPAALAVALGPSPRFWRSSIMRCGRAAKAGWMPLSSSARNAPVLRGSCSRCSLPKECACVRARVRVQVGQSEQAAAVHSRVDLCVSIHATQPITTPCQQPNKQTTHQISRR